MRGKRGISTVVATVLLILILTAAVAIIWVAILSLMQNLEFEDVRPKVQIIISKGYTLCDEDQDTLLVQLKRGNDDANIENVVLHLGIDGSTFPWTVPAPRPNSFITHPLDISSFGKCVESADVSPLIIQGNGQIVEGASGGKIDIPQSTISNVPPVRLTPPGSSVCGDGNLQGGEQCDDGNTVSGDGCSDSCQLDFDPNFGLIAWWEFEANAIDSAPAGNHDGTLRGATSYAPGVYGDALSLPSESNSDYVEILDDLPLDGLTEATMTGWIKRDSLNERVLFGIQDNPNDKNFIIEAWDDGEIYFQLGNDNSNELSYGVSSNDLDWHHVAFVFNGSESGNDRFKIHFDGVLQTDPAGYSGPGAPTSLLIGNSNFVIGRDGESGGSGSEGMIDDVRVYGYALNDSEILSVMGPGPSGSAPGPGGSIPPGLIAWWDFEGDTTQGTDKSGNDYHAVMNGVVNYVDEGGSRGRVLEILGEPSSDYLLTGTIPELNGIQEATLAGWIKKDSLGSPMQIGIQEDGPDFDSEPEINFLIQFLSDGSMAAHVSDTDKRSFRFTPVDDTLWHHVAFTYDGDAGPTDFDKLRVYFDGVLVNSGYFEGNGIQSLIDMDSEGFGIGRNGDSGGSRSDGRFDDIRIYDYPLTGSEIAALAGCVPGGVEICGNGIDDDCDGLVDYADSTNEGSGGDCSYSLVFQNIPLNAQGTHQGLSLPDYNYIVKFRIDDPLVTTEVVRLCKNASSGIRQVVLWENSGSGPSPIENLTVGGPANVSSCADLSTPYILDSSYGYYLSTYLGSSDSYTNERHLISGVPLFSNNIELEDSWGVQSTDPFDPAEPGYLFLGTSDPVLLEGVIDIGVVTS